MTRATKIVATLGRLPATPRYWNACCALAWTWCA